MHAVSDAHKKTTFLWHRIRRRAPHRTAPCPMTRGVPCMSRWIRCERTIRLCVFPLGLIKNIELQLNSPTRWPLNYYNFSVNFYTSPAEGREVSCWVIRVYVCVCVCVCLSVQLALHGCISPMFICVKCMLPAVVARPWLGSSFDGALLVLPVFWMTSYIHTVGQLPELSTTFFIIW